MANKKEFFTRIQHKHDTEENWLKATNFIPLVGEIIVYDADETYNFARIKIGDGITKVNDLPFEGMDLPFITVDDIDTICGSSIQAASEVIY